MARNYEYKEVNIADLILDDENPRFASSVLVQDSATKVSQTAIISHLLKYANIIKLANRINNVHELHGAELITCYKRDDGYVVLEGNRRTCACKLLLDRSLIPDNYKSNFPFINEETKENIERILVIVYPDREAVQAFLSDRHITGVKKWSALEKNNYYMNLFHAYSDISKVQEFTSDTLGTIKKCIRKYQFFMDVFHILKSRHKNIEIEKLDYLPMVDRFMDTLVGNDPEVGLNLSFDEDTQKYLCEKDKQSQYNEILMLIGEAFLLRKEKKYCINGELSKIVSTEIYGFSNQKELILKDERIPGLIAMIKDYHGLKSSPPTEDLKQDNPDQSHGTGDNQDGDPLDDDDGNSSNGVTPEDGNDIDEEKYIPSVKYKPKKTKREYLSFTIEESKSLKISGDSDFEVKIRSLIYDLSSFSVYRHPYACALLYRTLLEISTRLVYSRHTSTISSPYNEKDLVGNMKYLNNNFLFTAKTGKDIPKLKEAIKANLSNPDIIKILNLYIHYPNPVDEQILLSTWNSMKFYIQACLEK
ncbi:hypothetical protein Psfp_01491 [Pelotomaculum sp. FP]|uniref:hypothetical protein n=1 Tax=Pelotomaculum sp. FP TaxID=261474 RepID=UPI001065DBBA|nr:hypothetical protein [Pelotomaculum sp. FP]TEB16264.1 hypothetical protein Psfp_01491 [Pelotomaculum sp. FP]